MTWFVEDRRTWLQKQIGNLLKTGPIPKHIAFIMDGNRRYAKQNKMKQIQGHIQGFEKLAETLTWCYHMDIKEVTVYAFSIENFKRNKNEIDDLFSLAKEKFKKLLEEREKIEKLSVCIRIYGDMDMIPSDLRELMHNIVNITSKYDKLYLNICFAYTSRNEMTFACREICKSIHNGDLCVNDIDTQLIDRYLYTSNSLEINQLLRTSGEIRLSDFLLWQTSTTNTIISFVNDLWPQFSIWSFYLSLFRYQFNHILSLKNQFLSNDSNFIKYNF